MMREPLATTQTRQVRVAAKYIDGGGFFPASFECVDSWRQENQGFAQSTLFNVGNHSVVGGL